MKKTSAPAASNRFWLAPPLRQAWRWPACLFASLISNSDAPQASYARVFPVCTVAKIVLAHLLVTWKWAEGPLGRGHLSSSGSYGPRAEKLQEKRAEPHVREEAMAIFGSHVFSMGYASFFDPGSRGSGFVQSIWLGSESSQMLCGHFSPRLNLRPLRRHRPGPVLRNTRPDGR